MVAIRAVNLAPWIPPSWSSRAMRFWWEPEPVWKMHYQVTLDDGRELGIFRNMKTGSWSRRVDNGPLAAVSQVS